MSRNGDGEGRLSPATMLGIALALYLLWTLATYLLEGRIHLLISGDPAARLTYAVVANLLIGTVAALGIMNVFRRRGGIPRQYFGFQPAGRTLVSIAGAFALGLLIFVLQSPVTLDPVVVLNVFAQVFTTSTAEVLVVYALVGAAGAWLTRSLGRIPSIIVGIALASVLFGAYHIAHSQPFNTLPLILLLTLVGVVTGVFYFLVREIYATIVFHNFLALFGVVQSIDPANFQAPNALLLGMMVVTVAVLVGTEQYLLRRQP
ncbi:hypothetical protein FGU65_04915 [Methanoculleus sp. FWC-SCC1]|uniref:CAAX prenyl protease 2/Lysostaphin resistance protein A-like domain-containing protein n=1 Tax=Methanoculleus frigidifontis TaxID=2584085 RepID=A0ABT8M8I0_9EURY|nr:hypothetical protein [Methanoculleus sp. FWC-SCC1]MDN7024236.1 hypothetical protein [Methanoculleus sp. FWC-SCC1]